MRKTTHSPREFLAFGQSYYDAGKWGDAEKKFTQGIELHVQLSETPTIELLEYRARSREKQGLFDAAYLDARSMIRCYMTDKRGYLRVASVLEQKYHSGPQKTMKELEQAKDFLTHGLRRVNGTQSDHVHIQTHLDRISSKLSPETRIDPFNYDMPNELLDMILSYLPFRKLDACRFVSKCWRREIEARPHLWRHLDTSDSFSSRRKVRSTLVNRAIRCSDRGITHVTMRNFENNQVISSLAQYCRNLQYLQIIDGCSMSETLVKTAGLAENLHTLSVNTAISLDAITQILHSRPTITNAEFTTITSAYEATWNGPFPNLHTLTLNQSSVTGDVKRINHRRLLVAAPNLRCIRLENWLNPHGEWLVFRDTNLTDIILKKVDLPVFPLLPVTLERLELQPKRQMSLRRAPGHHDADSSWTCATISHVPLLTKLILVNMADLSPDFLGALLNGHSPDGDPVNYINTRHAAPLEQIAIRESTMSTNTRSLFGNGGLLTGSPRILTEALKAIDLSHLPVVDDDIDNLVNGHPVHPTTVNLTGTGVTGESIYLLVDVVACRLAALVLDQCHNISGRRAIDFAVDRGVHVTRRMNGRFAGGRNVRY